MSEPKCPSPEELGAYAVGQVVPPRSEEIDVHLNACGECHETLDRLTMAEGELTANLRTPAPKEFVDETECADALKQAIIIPEQPNAVTNEPTLLNAPRSGDTAPAPTVPPLGVLREYQLLEKLGQGGMGTVYKARHAKLGKLVALKVLPQDRMQSSDSVARFEREMRAVGSLSHPNIVGASDAGEFEGQHFLVMEYVEGTDLGHLSKRSGQLAVADACELVRQAALGLQHVHEHGLVHRDIKPSNLMLAKGGIVKILDLGLALLGEEHLEGNGELTSTGQIMGTVDYMAPEQGTNTHGVDIRADLYSLGATLYKLLTGRAPLQAEKNTTLMNRLLALANDAPAAITEHRKDVPPRLAQIVARLLSKSPGDRLQTPAELAEALAPFCNGHQLWRLTGGDEPVAEIGTSRTLPVPKQKPEKPEPAGKRRATGAAGRGEPPVRKRAAWAWGAFSAMLLAGIIVVTTAKGTVTIDIPPEAGDDVVVNILDGGEVVQVLDKQNRWTVTLSGGEYSLQLKGGNDEISLKENRVVVSRFGTSRAELIYSPKPEWLGEGNAAWHGWPADAPAPAIAPFDAAQARKHQEEWAAYLKLPVEYTNSIGMKFVLVPPGEFTMGSTPEQIAAALKEFGEDTHWQECIKSEAPQHKVILTQPIYLGMNEVTQAEYEKVMGVNPSHFAPLGKGKEAVAGLETAEHPVEMVSWNDAAEFCAKLSQQEELKPFYFRAGETITPLDGTGYRLPSEAEWDFACSAGTATKYWLGDQDADLVRAGWFGWNSGGRTHAAGELKANPFGLYDVHGNVWEWVQDGWDATYYGQFQDKPAINPGSPFSAVSQRVLRGGNWFYSASSCRSSFRLALGMQFRVDNLGFRVSLPVDAVRVLLKAEQPPKASVNTEWHNWPSDAPAPAVAPFDAVQARKHQEAWAAYLKVPVEYTNSIGMKFVLIPPGEYIVGSTDNDITSEIDKTSGQPIPENIRSETPQRKIHLSTAYYLGVHEVTQSEYFELIGINPSAHTSTGALKQRVSGLDTSNFPVETVDWDQARLFCEKLNRRDRTELKIADDSNRGSNAINALYRLPTEIEWEIAARAGTLTRFWSGDNDDDLQSAGWYGQNSGRRTHAVGELNANPFGLFDVCGNVWEWCLNQSEVGTEIGVVPSKGDTSTPPVTPGAVRFVRGGDCWPISPSFCRSASRLPLAATDRFGNTGFRVLLSVEGVRNVIAMQQDIVSRSSTVGSSWHGWPPDAPKPAIAPFDAAQARKHQEAWAAYLKVPVEYTNSIGMKFVLIPPGEFLMGSTAEEADHAFELAKDHALSLIRELAQSERPQHRVILTQPFFLCVTEVTQGQYQAVMDGNPSRFSSTGTKPELAAKVEGLETTDHPVENVSWNDAAEFCAQLSRRDALQPHYFRSGEVVTFLRGSGYQLPTEAEWEFACRAGTTTLFWIGNETDDLDRAAWHKKNSAGRTHPVGELLANPFGLHDVHGNVEEWVRNWWGPADYAEFTQQAAIDPSGPLSESRRIFRGGHWLDVSFSCRSSSRHANRPGYSDERYGFRVSLSVDSVRELTQRDKTLPGNRNFVGWHGWPADAPAPAVAPFDAAEARKHQEEWAAYLKVPVEYTNSIGMKFVLIPPGEFLMGSTEEEIAAANESFRELTPTETFRLSQIESEGPKHQVILTQPFYLCVHETRQADYLRVIGENPSHFSSTGAGKDAVAELETLRHPVDSVNWNHAVMFCRKLSHLEQLTPGDKVSDRPALSRDERGYRLPTEAEWEFACRAGTPTNHWFGTDEREINSSDWYASSSQSRTHSVGELSSNPFGLLDVHGNVAEWVQDLWELKSYEQFSTQPAIDSVSENIAGNRRVLRGGSWNSPPFACRSQYRSHASGDYVFYMNGFRIVLSVDAVSGAGQVE